jgi:hypothetical protein
MRILLLGAAALLTASALTGCSGTDEPEAAQETTQEAEVVEETAEEVESSEPATPEEVPDEPEGEPTEEPVEEPESVGGMTDCELGTVQAAVDQAAEALGPGNTFDIFMFSCEDGWLFVEGDLTAEGDTTSAPTALLFEAEGQFWVPKDLADVCVSEDPDDPASRPGDAFLPVQILNTGVCDTV